MRACHLIAALLLLCVSLKPDDLRAANIAIEEFSLANGLKVIVIPNHRVAAVSHMLWFPTGGADDPIGKSGLTHFHEHAMFKGTATQPPGAFEKIVSSLGGEQNAFAGYDTTAYYINIDKAHLARAMALEADRLRGLAPDAEDMQKEREVIIEERRQRVDTNPKALFNEQMASLLFVHHPYGTPLIGWQHEMSALTMEDVLDFHRTHYRVNQAVLVLAGDITAKEAKPMAEEYYGELEPVASIPQRLWVNEPPPGATKRLSMHHALVNEPYWRRDYLAPAIRTPVGEMDANLSIPLAVFAEALGGGMTSLLYQELVVKQKVATQVSASYSGFSRGPENFSISAVPAEGITIEALERAVDGVIRKATQQPFPEADVERAKTLLKAEVLYAREGLQGMAYMVGWIKMLGLEADYINQWPDLVDAVTPAQMQAAATNVFSRKGHVTGTLLPEVPSP